MDHNLEDALNLESAMVDFDHSEHEVVNQADISLDASGHEETIPMEYEHIEEQSMLMETGNEEIIDFMGDQFTLQGYETREGEVSAECIKMEPQENVTVSKAGSLLGIQFDEPMSVPASGVINTNEMNIQPKIIAVRAAVPTLRAIAPRREQVVVGKPMLPRQVAIAPKPAATQGAAQALPATVGRQYALAPKPLRAPAKPVTVVAKQALGHTAKGNTVLAIGKQLVVMPSAQKIKLLPGARRLPAADEQAQLIQNVSTSQAQGNKLQKVLVQGSQAELSNQPAVITKLISMGSTQPTQTRYVTMHHKPKTMPITIGNKKVMLASPGAGGLRYPAGSKSQLIAIKPPAPAQAPAQTPALQGITKKVVVRPNPTTHNVVLKAAPSPGIVTSAAPHKTQVHQINVPGKGIQYIRLVSNPTPAVKPVQKPSAPSKTFVLTDGKGNLIQMTTEKVMATQPPPLLLTGNATASKVTSKPPHKLVRLAPVSSKLGQSAMQNRGGQSLLAPLSPTPEEAQPMRVPEPELDEAGQLLYSPDQPALQQPDEYNVQEEEIDSKAALRALIADTVGSEGGDDEQHNTSTDIDVELERTQGREYSDSNGSGAAAGDHPLIVIPPYSKQDPEPPADNYESSQLAGGLINVELDVGGAYDYQPRPDIDMVGAELGLLTRKACNCTKSQCLKLYCDCFANGEFCNNCHCNNCHNNLDNEELRQKAIRGCLDRNPNAFRPKIGKSKAGGPDNLRRHNKGCNCKRSGCLKNYCECYEAKIACTNICKCVGCRNVEDSLERARRRDPPRAPLAHPAHAQPRHARPPAKQPCSFMTSEVIEAVCQCLLAAAVEGGGGGERDAVGDVIDEFARCLQDIIGASHHAALLDEAPA